MTIELCYYGHPTLRKKAKPVEKVTQAIKDVSQEMIEKLEPWKASGIAATQISIDQRFFVLAFIDRDEKDEWVAYEPRVYVNPKISNPSEKTWVYEEGCISIPDIMVLVERPWSIDIEASDLDGKLIKEHLQGYPARQFMHENDHLNGVLTIDRTDKKSRSMVANKLRKIKKKYNS